MPKTRTPLLSLEAHGTLGGSVTYQGKGARKTARSKPRLPYFLTLPSQYQRWLYADYIAQWNNLTDTEKQVWRSAGSRRHLTGLQEFMRYNLKYLPDLAGYWKLDSNHGATTPDSSRNGNVGTIIGASPATGIIDRCLSFDGINDDVTIPHHASLDVGTGDFTLLLFIKAPLQTVNWRELLNKGTSGVSGWNLYDHLAGTPRLRIGFLGPGGPFNPCIPLNYTTDIWQHLAFVIDWTADTGTTYLNGALVASTPNLPAYVPGTANFTIAGPNNWTGIVDHLLIFNRALTAAEVYAHSQRRWPLE